MPEHLIQKYKEYTEAPPNITNTHPDGKAHVSLEAGKVMVSCYFQGHSHFFALQPTFPLLAQDESSWCSLTYSPSPCNENSRGGVVHSRGNGEDD